MDLTGLKRRGKTQRKALSSPSQQEIQLPALSAEVLPRGNTMKKAGGVTVPGAGSAFGDAGESTEVARCSLPRRNIGRGGKMLAEQFPVFIGLKLTGSSTDAEIIALALTDPDGNSLYLELEFDGSKVQEDWIKEGVIPNLHASHRYHAKEVEELILQWLESTYLGVVIVPILDSDPYGWILFCRLFANGLPDFMSHNPLDLHTLLWARGLDPSLEREHFLGERFAGYGYSALWDSWVVWRCFSKLHRKDYELYRTEDLMQFDQRYFDYVKNRRKVDYSAELSLYEAQAQWFNQYIEPVGGKCFLDIGCAMGMSLLAVQNLGARVVGVDISQWAVRNSSMKGFVSLLAAEGGALPFREDCFDIIRCVGVLEHMREDNALGLLEESFRVLRKGGMFCGLATTRHWPGDDLTHINIKSREGWQELLARAGFTVLHRDLPTRWEGREMVNPRDNGWFLARVD